MLFTVSAYLSISIFLIGIVVRFVSWFISGRKTKSPPSAGESVSPSDESRSEQRSGADFGQWCPRIFRTIFLDVFLQYRLRKIDRSRWIGHLLMFFGFLALLLLHGLDRYVTRVLFPNYVSTLNPFLFLRELFGCMLLAGVLMALFRRVANRTARALTTFADRYAVALLLAIVLSGFGLEAAKIVSAPIFGEMVTDYMDPADGQEAVPLKLFWARHYGVVFPDRPASFPAGTMEEGLRMHREFCAPCHANPASAFVAFPLSKPIRPIANFLNAIRIDKWIVSIHFLACFLGLALLPFTKFFHIVADPVVLWAGGRKKGTESSPLLRAVELDACTHCGACTEHCSVRPVFRLMRNSNILPSEKLRSIKKWDAAGTLREEELFSLAEGSFICTDCHRCTDICPVGIDLHEQWRTTTQRLAARGMFPSDVRTEPASATEAGQSFPAVPACLPVGNDAENGDLGVTEKAYNVSNCIQCRTCTNVCPVVAQGTIESPPPDITPQQVVNLVHLGLRHIAADSGMVRDCVTCYACQENCPQKIPVTDIMLELRARAYCRKAAVIDTRQDTTRLRGGKPIL